MLQVLHKILAVVIALVVLFSSLSFTVEKHVCMGEITDTSYFNDADTCGMTTEECDLDEGFGNSYENQKCCDTIQQLIPGNQNTQQAIDGFELNQVQFIVAFTYSYLNLFRENSNTNSLVDYSPPPLVDKDIQVLYQTFLI